MSLVSLKGKIVLVTAGPTREYIDPVRYLSNPSTGQMGYALAEAAQQAGAKVILISGPTSLLTPARVKRINVVSAAEMNKETQHLFSSSDITLMVAAVADYSPNRFFKKEIKKTASFLSQHYLETDEGYFKVTWEKEKITSIFGRFCRRNRCSSESGTEKIN